MNEEQKKKNLLENGTYEFTGPENGDIFMETLELRSTSGAKRVWKVKSISQKEIAFEIQKFG